MSLNFSKFHLFSTKTMVKLKRIGKADDCSSIAFIFHHVGGDGASFREFAKSLTSDASLNVYLVVLPGRALSQKSQVLRSIPAAADQVYAALIDEVEKSSQLSRFLVSFLVIHMVESSLTRSFVGLQSRQTQ